MYASTAFLRGRYTVVFYDDEGKIEKRKHNSGWLVWWSWSSHLRWFADVYSSQLGVPFRSGYRCVGRGFQLIPAVARTANRLQVFPRWRQHTGSGLPDRSLICPTAEIKRATLRQSPFIERTRPLNRGPSWKTTSDLLPPRLKTFWIDWASLKQS